MINSCADRYFLNILEIIIRYYWRITNNKIFERINCFVKNKLHHVVRNAIVKKVIYIKQRVNESREHKSLFSDDMERLKRIFAQNGK